VLTLLGALAVGVAITIIGVMLRDASPGGSSVAAESLRNAGIAVVGGVTVGAVITVVQRAINADLAARSADAERRRSIDLVVDTRQELRTIDLSGADLRGRYLVDKDLSSAELGDADLRNASLRGAKLVNARLVGTHLTGADLAGADLTEADPTGADLTGADLTGANLTGVVVDETTRWPDSGIPQPPSS
jgi:uncharacterized protein YjbI with pentapeptide repeats